MILVFRYRLGRAYSSDGVGFVDVVDLSVSEERDDALHLLQESLPQDREGLLRFCVDMIRTYRPSVVKVVVGDGTAKVVSGRTVAEIVNGLKGIKDLQV